MKPLYEEELVFPDLPAQQFENEWQYTMRRDMQEIIPNVYLGPYSAAVRSKLDYLQSHGITHIVCIRHPMECKVIKPNFPDLFTYMVLDIVDHPDEQIIKHFSVVKEFIDNCLSNQGKVLIHSNAGMSRSASLVIAYLMETFGLNYNVAWLYVLKQRFCVFPNEGFVRQLVEYEPIYLANYQLKSQSQRQVTLKRSIEDDVSDSNKRCTR